VNVRTIVIDNAGLDRLVSMQQARISADLRQRYVDNPCESPIEKLLATAIYAETAYRPYTDQPLRLLRCEDGARGPCEGADTSAVYMAFQAQINDRRVDMVLWAFGSGKWHRLLIECDGHEFHERSPKQAEADKQYLRKCQFAGDTVFPFTGSEIVNKPTACADQVLRWADAIQGGARG
jgi:hypothetical protein